MPDEIGGLEPQEPAQGGTTPDADVLFQRMSSIVPPRSDVRLPDDGGGAGGATTHSSLKKRMKEAPTLSDMQTADKRLFPPVEIDGEIIGWLSDMQVARVFPETYVPLRNMIAKHLMQTYAKMGVVEAFCIAERVLSTGIEGDGRIDELQLVGRAAALEKEKETKLA